MHLCCQIGCRKRHHSFLFYSYAVLLGILWAISTVHCIEYERVSRKLLSSPEPDLDGNKFSNEDLRSLLSILEGKLRSNDQPSTTTTTTTTSSTTERASAPDHKSIPPELMRIHTQPTAPTSTSAPATKIVTRRFYRRLRRKTTTTPSTSTTTTKSPLTTTTSTTARPSSGEVESGRALPTSATAAGEFLQQLNLLNGILGALNASATPSPAPLPYIALPSSENSEETKTSTNANGKNDGTGPSVPDILAILTGAKQMVGDASSKSETIVAPPPPPSPSPPVPQPSPTSIGQQVDDPAAALALLNIFSNSNANSNGNNNVQQTKDSSESNSASTAALLNLLSQSQPQTQSLTQSQSTSAEADTTAALTKLLLQSAGSSQGQVGQPMQSNSILQNHQPQAQSAEASANQLTSLLGLLGTLGAAAGQQPQSNSINNLFNLGGDQMAQAQTPTNQLASLFGAQQQQQNQAQNLLSLLGGNQGGQGFNIASLLGGQGGNQNAIPGLGLLSTVSSLGSSLLGSVSSIFSGSRDGKPRVRGKGVDTRVGLGYRLGNIGDAQVVWDIGPQLFTEPLRNEMRPYTKKRESGAPSPTAHYFQPSSTTAAEKEVQQIEAKRRMVQAAIQDHYRGDHFASVYPKQSKRRTYDYSSYYSPSPAPTLSSYSYSHTPSKPKSSSSSSSSSSSFFSLPIADHIKGFWSGLTSGIMGKDDSDSDSSSASHYYNFDDVRSDFSANLIKRSSPDYRDYESRAYHPRRLDDDKIDDPTHSTLTEYERMLLQYGKDIGVANTQHGVIEDEEPAQSDSNIFSRWFKNPLSSISSSLSSSQTTTRRKPATEWDSMSSGSNEYASHVSPPQTHQKSVKKTFRQPPSHDSSMTQYNLEGSFNRRNDHPRRTPSHRPQKRRSHNPFRNFITSLKQTAGFGGGQRSRPQHQQQTKGFGRRHFKRPSSGNPQLQHFTNTNKDLMMADTNDDFMASAGRESVPHFSEGYEQPLSYKYADEFPDVSLTDTNSARTRLRTSATSSSPSAKTRNSQLRAALIQREKIIEPALLYDHLEIQETPMMESEMDESFHTRNKVVVNPTLRDIEKQKILGTPVPIITSTAVTKMKSATPSLATLQKLQRQRINKLRSSLNSTALYSASGKKKKIVVKVKGDSSYKKPVSGDHDHAESHSESTTVLPSVLSTISSLFSGTSKPKLRIGDLIHNASSLLPSISSIRILPRKKKKDNKTKLTMMNGKPTIIGPPDDEDDELDAEGSEHEPVVQVGHDMDFSQLQQIFAPGSSNSTKKKRIRIRVKESVLKGEKEEKDSKERKESDEDEDGDDLRDIFVDIESGEVSVLKPVASLVSFAPKKEEKSEEEEVDYYEDDDGDGVADMDMKRKEHIFDAIQQQLVKSFEKMKKAQQRAEKKKRRKQELAEKGMDESIDQVTKFFDIMQNNEGEQESKPKPVILKNPGGLSFDKKR